ncbi:CDP-alcohol phosphatidyltransferase family protein, partial [Micromonospora zhanjiangensis]
MTLAVLITGPSGPEPLTLPDGRPLLDRLGEQLRQAGATEVVEVGELTGLARLADSASGPLLLCAADLVAHTAVLRHLATSPVP